MDFTIVRGSVNWFCLVENRPVAGSLNLVKKILRRVQRNARSLTTSETVILSRPHSSTDIFT
jgi:hypothetical protein